MNINDSPLLRFFGFTSNIYEGSSDYTSEMPHIGKQNVLNTEYFLFIQEDLTKSPLVSVDKDGNIKYNIINFDKPKSFEMLEINFHDKYGELISFDKKPHNFKLTLEF